MASDADRTPRQDFRVLTRRRGGYDGTMVDIQLQVAATGALVWAQTFSDEDQAEEFARPARGRPRRPRQRRLPPQVLGPLDDLTSGAPKGAGVKMTAWVDGELLPLERATVHVLDQGFRTGEGVFETMRAYAGHTFRLARHLDRAAAGATTLGFEVPHTTSSRPPSGPPSTPTPTPAPTWPCG